jgi:very-short-patch-repair endonuclease
MDIDYSQAARDRGLYYNGKHLPYAKQLIQHAKALRKNPTAEERTLWNFIKTLPVHTYRQRPIDHYIVDFYIHDILLVIELDGSHHFTMEGKEYDEYRTSILESYGLNVLRISNDEIRSNFIGVCKRITELIQKK